MQSIELSAIFSVFSGMEEMLHIHVDNSIRSKTDTIVNCLRSQIAARLIAVIKKEVIQVPVSPQVVGGIV